MSIHFESEIVQINKIQLIRVPIEASEKLPSRGMVMVNGTINQTPIEAALEPDGLGSHWFEVSNKIISQLKAQPGDLVLVKMQPLSEWEGPELPMDMAAAIDASGLTETFATLTAKAKWDWVRWIRSTKSNDTRKKRIEVMVSKLENGEKRPCCFNRNQCTVMDVSKSGRLSI